ncbi:MAG: RHS repeat-associated core domain-containing protein, partial [Bacteroidota bacterium]
YINYLVFDKEMNFVTASFTQITAASNGTMALVTATDYIADREGYVMVYLSNETQGSELVVSWDDLEVYHGKTNVVSADSYYPFGITFSSYERMASTVQRFKYNNKEFHDEIGLYDYGARFYEPSIALFTSIDPRAEDYYSWSPYNYVGGNPIKRIDINGEGWGLVVKIAKSAYKVSKRTYKIYKKTGKLDAKSIGKSLKQEGLDILDNALTLLDGQLNADDAFATIDLLTGFGGEAKKASKALGIFDDAGDAKKLNKNANNAEGNFVLYEVKDGGDVLKVGKANADDVMSDGTVRRLRTSERKAQKEGYTNAQGEVVKDLGTTTTGKAKEAEAARVRNHRSNGNELPLNREKDKRYQPNGDS